MRNLHTPGVLPKAFVLLALLAFVQCTPSGDSAENEPYVIILSMDGFRWDYAERVSTPNLDYIAANGVKADYVVPAFPSNTFPNHYTMATGLYPDNHGLVNNSFYCPDLDMTYSMRDRDAVENGAFYGGEPIWVTAEKQGLTAASYFWVGSEAPVQGIQPTYWKEYNNTDPFAARIDTVAYWLQLPEPERPRLITLYFNEPDGQGHRTGPDSEEIDLQVMELDVLVGYLLEQIQASPLAGQINLIIASDHGFTQRHRDRYIDLSQYVDRDWIDLAFGGNPTMLWRAKEGMEDILYNQLKDVDNMYIYKTGQLPERLNFGHNPRTLDLVVMADSAWSIGWGEPWDTFHGGGSHGWDNAAKDMHTIFYAIGPAFKEGHLHPAFELVDLYPLMAHILNLDPAPVDGKLERVSGMLQ